MADMTLIQSEDFAGDGDRFVRFSDETIFVYCHFADFEISGPGVAGVLLGCEFKRILWYWELFNGALVSRTTFEDCVFQGCSFSNVDFVGCTFTRCGFKLDNLGGGCEFDRCRFVDCGFENCEFTPSPPTGREPLFQKCRFHDCAQHGTRGERPPFA